jgi:hypothetical protein
VINWALTQIFLPGNTLVIKPQFADYRDVPNSPRRLPQTIEKAVQDFPCDLLFVHRDAEREPPARRRREILEAAQEAGFSAIVCVVPVRMTEAWLLFNETAVRRAAGNPHGTVQLRLPPLNRLEREPDPKVVLRAALETASEARGRRLRQFQRDLPMLVHRVAELIEDFSPLQSMEAFRFFYEELQAALASLSLLRVPD